MLKTLHLQTQQFNSSHAVLLPPLFFAETFRSFLLRHFGHLSHSCIETCHNSVFSLFLQTFWPKWLNFFGHFKNVLVYDWKKKKVLPWELKWWM